MRLKRKFIRVLPLIITIVLGLILRMFLAPYSSGSDIPQFLGFANTLVKHGFCFYKYAYGDHWIEEKWPYPWPYVYPPLWALVLAMLKIIVNGEVHTFYINSTYFVKVSTNWILAIKTLLVLADTINTLLIYKLSKKVGYAALYYLNPVIIYNSAIYGMFEPLCLVFFLLALFYNSHYKYRERSSLILLGISVAIKQILAILLLATIFKDLKNKGVKKTFKNSIYMLIPIILSLIPFIILCSSSLSYIIRCLFYPYIISYVRPLCYSFNGISSLLTYIYDNYGIETLDIIRVWPMPFIFFSVLILWKTYHSNLGNYKYLPFYLMYATFIATYWRVNYQYLVVLVVLGILALLEIKGMYKLIVLLFTVLYPSFWLTIFPIQFWFIVHVKEPNFNLIRWVAKFTINISCFDVIYVIYSLIFTFVLYIIILLFILKPYSGQIE